MEGWIKISRQITEDGLYFDGKFDRMHAWIDLLLIATAQVAKNVRVRGIEVELQPGDIAIAENNLADRWGWSRNTVRKFLQCLEVDNKIVLRKSQIINIISVVNWQKYQQVEQQNEQQIEQQIEQQNEQQEEKERTKEKEEIKKEENILSIDNIEKKERTSYFVVPKIEDIKAYINRQNYSFDAESFYDFYESKGWMVGKNKMKDWKAAVRNWQRMDKERNTRNYYGTAGQDKYDRRRATEVTANRPEDYEGRFI